MPPPEPRAAGRCLPAMLAAALAVPLLLSATPLKGEQVLLRAPGDGRAVGRLVDAPVQLGAWTSPTTATFTHRGARFDLDAALDTRDPGTHVAVPVRTALRLAGTGPWTVIAQPGATLALLGGQGDGLAVGFLRRVTPPTPTAVVPATPLEVPSFAGPPLTCAVRALHAEARAESAAWVPSSVGWRVHRAGPDAAGWTPAWAEARGAHLVVLGFVAARDLECGVGTGGGFGMSGFGSSGDGFVTAREVRLPRGAALFSDADGGTRLAVLHQAARALWLDDGSVRVEVNERPGPGLSLHGVFPAPGFTAPDAGPRTQHGVGSSGAGDDQWPHPCPDGGAMERPCYDEHAPR